MSLVSSPAGAAVAARRTPLSAAACAALSAVAALPLLLGTGPIKAQTTAAPPVVQLERVTVTANRFEALLDELPAGVTLITAEQIRNSGASTANEAIWRLAGVVNRLNLGIGSDRTLDLRGFGPTADNNTVYLVDGVRLNEGDSSPASLSWLPVDAIDRIEITRGSGTVLYGEGATGGVVHIITRNGITRSGGSVTARSGSLNTGGLSGEAHFVRGPWQVQVAGSSMDTNQHRNNFQLREHNASVNALWAQDGTRLGIKLASQAQAGGLPAGLDPQRSILTPEVSLKFRDSGSTATDLLGLNLQINSDEWKLASDLSLRHKTYAFTSFSYNASGDVVTGGPYAYSANARAVQWGVRGQRDLSSAGLKHQLTVGTDLERWSQDRSYGAAIRQSTNALFAQDEITVERTGTKVLTGLRRIQTDRSLDNISDPANTLVSRLNGAFNTWELGLTQPLGAAWQIHGKWGRSLRLANADEYVSTCYVQPCPALSLNLLNPQFSHDAELGLRFGRPGEQTLLRYYRHALTNEIGYDAAAYANVNFAPTLREGLELEHRRTLSPTLSVTGQLALRRAVFRSGLYAGNQIPQTAQRSAALRLRYSPDARHHLEVGGQWMSRQRVSDDFDNLCTARIAGGGVLDARYAMDWEDWTFALAVNNLADRRYASLRTVCAASAWSVYPEPGRTLMLSARVNF